MKTITYYYLLYSPWTYMGHQRLEAMAAQYGAVIDYRPVNFKPVLDAAGGLPLAQRPQQRKDYRMAELRRWREFLGLPLVLEPKFFPVNDALAAGMVIAAQRAGLQPGALSFAILRACWAEERNIADPETLAAIADGLGLDGAALLKAAQAPDVAAEWQANTDRAIAEGVFGAPTTVLDGELFWGQDRLDFLERALAKGA